ncbi:MAG: type II toxin-antitoxin system RelE/ParE family toxin [Caulobacterales bacterium]|jgi:plasmid stabilization system protein ParE
MGRLTVEHTKEAVADLGSLNAWLSTQGTQAQTRIGKRLLETLRLLSEYPAIAPPIGSLGLRFKFIPPTKLMILYRFYSVSVQILRIYDGRQNRSLPD